MKFHINLEVQLLLKQGQVGFFDDLEGVTSRFSHLEKFSLNFSSSSFVIRVNLLHP